MSLGFEIDVQKKVNKFVQENITFVDPRKMPTLKSKFRIITNNKNSAFKTHLP